MRASGVRARHGLREISRKGAHSWAGGLRYEGSEHQREPSSRCAWAKVLSGAPGHWQGARAQGQQPWWRHSWHVAARVPRARRWAAPASHGKGHGKGLRTGTAWCDRWDAEATTARGCQELVKTRNQRGGDGDYQGRRKVLSQQPQA